MGEQQGAVDILGSLIRQLRPPVTCPPFWRRVIVFSWVVLTIDTVAVALLMTAHAGDLRSLGEALSGARSVSLHDGTDVLIKATSDAGRVTELVALVLKDRGYLVCTGCTADAQATVSVYKYDVRQDRKRRKLVDMAESKWSLVIMRNNEVVFRRTIHHEKPTALETLAARQVHDMLRDLPSAQ